MESNQEIINEIEAQYDIDIKTFKPLHGGWINQKFFIKDKRNKEYVFKELSLDKFPKNYFSTLCETVKIQNELYKERIKVPKIILNNKGEYITKTINNKYYFMQTFLKGDQKDFNELNICEIKDIGKTLALIHKVLQTKDKSHFNKELLKYKTISILNEELKLRKNQITDDTPHEYIEELNHHQKIIDDLEQSKFLETKTTQLIHGDFTPDNIIFSNNKVIGVIDFELMRINSPLQDIGRIVLSTCFYNNEFDSAKLNSFITGYLSEMPINENTIVDSIKMVWANEVNIWIQERYFKNYNPAKVEKFIEEIKWISTNWYNLKEIMKGVISIEET